MFRLKLPTDPRWANIAEKNIEEILTDHAFCEQKAASTAISLITQFSEKQDLVVAMVDLAREEMEHFQRVHNIIINRGYKLGRERKDEYVNELAQFIFKPGYSREEYLINKLLFAALIEARSCERFKVLSENINDKELSDFYRELMASEANHYTLFIGFARQYSKSIDVEKRWQEILDEEAIIIAKYGTKEHIHG
jgi:tRNA 2-(methylsulfanyl)-N6-isopentenyladenosine37 hydroxylase